MIDSNPNAKHAGETGTGESWDINGVRLYRTEAYLRRKEDELAARADELQRLADQAREAQLAYQASLRAVSASAAVAPRPAYAPVAAEPEPKPYDELTDHNYDGIQEYDNPTPGWWHMVFIGSIAFSLLYVLVYHFSGFVPSLPERHASAESRALDVRFAELNTIPMGEEKILKIMAQPAWLDQGASIYTSTCALCHGQQGEGLVGPNMTDDYYKNATDLASIADVIANGAANGAMPAQKNALNENEIALVAAYMASLRGKNLPSTRPHEGEVIAPWPTLAEDGTVRPAPVSDPGATTSGSTPSGDA
jgi:cytochrome c oxidase cbb3-type subunit 3